MDYRKKFLREYPGINEGLTDEEANLLKSEFNEKFGVELPAEYLTFLKLVNGYDCDLITFYGYNTDTYGSERGYVDPKIDIMCQKHFKAKMQKHFKVKIFLGDDSYGNPIYYRMNGITWDLFCLERFEPGSDYSEVIEFLSFEELLEYVFGML